MKAPVVKETANPKVPLPEDGWFVGEFPNLWEGMTASKNDKGKPRPRHTWFVRHNDGCFEICMKDNEHGVEAWFKCVQFLDVLQLMETACETGEASWAKVKVWKGKKGQ